MLRKSWLLAFLFLAWLVPAAPAQDVFYRPEVAASDIEPTLRSDWFGLYHDGKKIGFYNFTRSRDGENVVERFTMTLKLLSFGKKAEMNISQSMTFEGKPPFRLLSGQYDEAAGGNKQTISINRMGKGFEHTVLAAGQKQTRQLADLDYSLADASAEEIWLRRAPKIGAEILTKDLNLKAWHIDPTKCKIEAVKKSLVSGVEVTYFEVRSESRKEMVSVLARHDFEGKMISGKLALVFELRKEPEDQAKNIEFSKDLFVLGMAKIDRKIGRTTELTELVLELAGKASDSFEDGPRQTVVAKEGDVRLVKIGKKHAKEVKLTEKEIEENLAETTEFPISNPKVKALAQKAIGDAKTPEEKVRRIVTFVKEYITPHLVVSLPNIHELIESKKGDCKCYARLTANLCRAAGVPAREVGGLLYMGDDVKAFGGHAWNEVALNGVWVPVDASLDEFDLDAGHICFGPDNRATKHLLNSLGKLSFKLVEVQTK